MRHFGSHFHIRKGNQADGSRFLALVFFTLLLAVFFFVAFFVGYGYVIVRFKRMPCCHDFAFMSMQARESVC